ncbi:hypothetical protein [Alkaliphilus pronyensis]|nr:hypothetical protein [Alkaliphilus pronyensis]
MQRIIPLLEGTKIQESLSTFFMFIEMEFMKYMKIKELIKNKLY